MLLENKRVLGDSEYRKSLGIQSYIKTLGIRRLDGSVPIPDEHPNAWYFGDGSVMLWGDVSEMIFGG